MSKSRPLKTPGVYVEEVSILTPSIAQLPTAITGFVGYTEINSHHGISLQHKAVKIQSMLDYETHFGKASKNQYQLHPVSVAQSQLNDYDVFIQNQAYQLQAVTNRLCLYEAIKWYFQNGGGDCYVVSIGTYTKTKVIPNFSIRPFLSGLLVLESVLEVTLLVIPEAVFLEPASCYELQEALLAQCERLENRFAILDVHSGHHSFLSSPNPIETFRTQINGFGLNFAAAYYPSLHTSLKSSETIDYTNLNAPSRLRLRQICERYSQDHLNAAEAKALTTVLENLSPSSESRLSLSSIQGMPKDKVHNTLNKRVPDYKLLLLAILKLENLMPPSAAIAGVYTKIDANRGVWKAPANVGLSGVIAAAVQINNEQNEALNVHVSGKSVNGIREFSGKGILVWGARTLAANNYETRYVHTVRTLISIEQSVKLALKPFAFEPNNQNTWVRIKSMVENYLNNFWRNGALQGEKPDHAYYVKIGLNETMTPQDINDSRLLLELGVALTRPAEFVISRISEQLATH